MPRWDIQPNLVVLIQSIGRPVGLRPAPMRRVLFVALALLCLASCATRAQSCEAFSDTSSACSAHLPPGALVHVPASLTLQNLTDATDVALASALSLPPPCGFFAARQICLRGLRLCAADGEPVPLCPAVCTDYNDACGPRGLAQIDCRASQRCAPQWTCFVGAAVYAAENIRRSVALDLAPDASCIPERTVTHRKVKQATRTN